MARSRNPVVLLAAFAIGVLFAVLLFSTMARAQTAAQERGEAVYDHWCAPCHAPGPGHPGTQSLEIKYRGELPAVLTEREDLTAELVRTFVREGILLMAPFRKTEITDAELEDLAAYLAE
jgi:mono/diheme cytochrome c family protein